MSERLILGRGKTGDACLALDQSEDGCLELRWSEGESTTAWRIPAPVEAALYDALRRRTGALAGIRRVLVPAWPTYCDPADLEALAAIQARAEARRDAGYQPPGLGEKEPRPPGMPATT
jgi:hypothetical protein